MKMLGANRTFVSKHCLAAKKSPGFDHTPLHDRKKLRAIFENRNISQNITFDTDSVDLSAFDGIAASVDIAANGALRVLRDLSLDGVTASRQVQAFADAVELAPGAGIQTNFGPGAPTLFALSTSGGIACPG